MSSRFRIRLMGTVIVLLVLVGSAIIFFGLKILEMGSPTMQPVIFGRSQPERPDGDRLLITTRIRPGSFRRGDLVVVQFPSWSGTGVVSTVRRITGLPGETVTDRSGSVHLLAPDSFWVEAKQTNGLDSHAFGPIHRDSICGRVIHVFRVSRLFQPRTPSTPDE